MSKQLLEATIYKGKQGLKSVMEDVINTKKQLLVFGAEGKLTKNVGSYAIHWHKAREKQKIMLKIIYNKKIRGKKLKQNLPQPITMRFNSQMEDTPATTWIFGDKVAIIVWGEQP